MPVQTNNPVPDYMTPETDGGGSGYDFSDFLSRLTGNAGFENWLQFMLRNLGYGITAPGETPPATPAPAATDPNIAPASTARPAGADPFGANWSPGMKLSNIDWSQRQVNRPADKVPAVNPPALF